MPGLFSLSLGALQAWQTLVQPEEIPVPFEVTLRQIHEEQELVRPLKEASRSAAASSGGEFRSALEREDLEAIKKLAKESEARAANVQQALSDYRRSLEGLQAKHAEEIAAERTAAANRALWRSAGFGSIGLLLIGVGAWAWLRSSTPTAITERKATEIEQGMPPS